MSRTTFLQRDPHRGSLQIISPKPEKHWSSYNALLDHLDTCDQYDNELREDDPVSFGLSHVTVQPADSRRYV